MTGERAQPAALGRGGTGKWSMKRKREVVISIGRSSGGVGGSTLVIDRCMWRRHGLWMLQRIIRLALCQR